MGQIPLITALITQRRHLFCVEKVFFRTSAGRDFSETSEDLRSVHLLIIIVAAVGIGYGGV